MILHVFSYVYIMFSSCSDRLFDLLEIDPKDLFPSRTKVVGTVIHRIAYSPE